MNEIGSVQIIGRVEELKTISNWSSADHRELLLVSGAAGVGKSALLEASSTKSHEVATIVSIVCQPTDRGDAALVDAVAHLLSIADQDGIEVPPSTLEGLRPFTDGAQTGSRQRRRRSPGPGRQRFDARRLGERPHHQALVELLALVGSRRRVTLHFDGLERLTPSAASILRHVVLTQPRHGASVVGAARDYVPPHALAMFDELRTSGSLVEIDLPPLEAEESRTLAERSTPDSPNALNDIEAIIDEAQGNPRALLVGLGVVTDPHSVDFDRVRGGLSEHAKRLAGRLAVIRTPLPVSGLLPEVYPVEQVSAVDEGTACGWLKAASGRNNLMFVDDDIADRLIRSMTDDERRAVDQWAIKHLDQERPGDPRVLDFVRKTASSSELFGRLIDLGSQAAESHRWDEAAELLGEAASSSHPMMVPDVVDLAEARRRTAHALADQTVGAAFDLAVASGQHSLIQRVALLRARPGDFTTLGTVDAQAVSRLEQSLVSVDPSQRDDEAILLAALAEELLFDPDLNARKTIASKAWVLSSHSADPDVRFIGQLAIRNALVQPEQLDERIAAGRRLVELAEISGNDWDLAHSHVLLSGNMLERGDRAGFETRLDLAEALNRALRSPRLDYLISTRRSAAMIMEGRFVEAEASIERDLQAATAAGFGADYAFGLYGTQLSSIRGNQGRLGEMLEPIEYAVRQAPDFQPYAAMLAYVRAEGALGDPDLVAASLRSMASEGFADFRRDYFWLSTMTLVARSATLVRALDVCELCLDLMRPFSGRMAWSGTSNTGAIDWYLGGLCGALDRLDEAHTLLTASAAQYRLCSMPVGLRHAERHLDAIRTGRFDEKAAAIDAWVE